MLLFQPGLSLEPDKQIHLEFSFYFLYSFISAFTPEFYIEYLFSAWYSHKHWRPSRTNRYHCFLHGVYPNSAYWKIPSVKIQRRPYLLLVTTAVITNSNIFSFHAEMPLRNIREDFQKETEWSQHPRYLSIPDHSPLCSFPCESKGINYGNI